MERTESEQPSDLPQAEPGGEAAQAAPDDASLESELSRAKDDAQKYLDNWRRAEADLQNYKRRAEQERDESRRFSHASLIINLLPIVDDFERALGSVDIRLAGLTWLDGIRLIYRKLLALLENAGVSPIAAEGQTFDPRVHEAISHAEGEEGKVVAEVQRGYKLHDRVLRPAMVIVGKEPGTGNKEQGEEEGRGKAAEEEGESGATDG